jgi:hypothetical protein
MNHDKFRRITFHTMFLQFRIINDKTNQMKNREPGLILQRSKIIIYSDKINACFT